MAEIQLYETETARLRFRRLRADDFSDVAAILQDEQAMQAWGRALSRFEVIDWIADMLRRYQEEDCGCFAAIRRETGELVALAGPLTGQLEDGQTVLTLVCIVRPDCRGQGYGTECAAASLRFAFDRLDAARVIARIRSDNLPALHVAAACGMRPVGQDGPAEAPLLLCAAER